MEHVECRRCGQQGAALERQPLPGALGEQIRAGVCAPCWQVWLGEQVKLINELRISPAVPEQYDRLVGEMRVFLKLGDD